MKLMKPRIDSASSTQSIFQGSVLVSQVAHFNNSNDSAASDLKVGLVTFCSGSRTQLHVHDGDQILMIVDGDGHIGGPREDIEVSAGDVVHIPAGEPHYHGASESSSMSHYSLLAGARTEILGEVASWPPNPTIIHSKASL
jgi:quercetin dioxygenase-like cupin family protein